LLNSLKRVDRNNQLWRAHPHSIEQGFYTLCTIALQISCWLCQDIAN